MTPAKLAALRLLAVESRFTEQCTTGARIGGRVAKCLEREGLARRLDSHQWPAMPRYEITQAGRDALQEAGG